MHEFFPPLLGILLAVALSIVIGVEREFYAKSAGMRTYALVGMGAALFTVVSKYGFSEFVLDDFSRVDGSRVAAQVVSGIGFLGAGLIFVRRDAVRGLTTAAGVWFVGAIGMACGAGLYALAAAVTGMYLLIMVGIRPLSRRIPHAASTSSQFRVRYLDGKGVLRDVIASIGGLGLKVTDLEVLGSVAVGDQRLQEISLAIQGSRSALLDLPDELYDTDGVESVIISGR